MNEIEKGYELIRRVENNIITHELAFAENTKALLKIVKQLKADKQELVSEMYNLFRWRYPHISCQW